MKNELIKIFKDKKFLKEIAIILLVGIIVNALCFFLCSITGHCANEDPNEQFPYQIGIPSNVPIPSEVVNQAINDYIYILSSQYGYDGSNGALCFLENNDSNRYIITCCDALSFDISSYPTTFVYHAIHQHWVQFVYDSSTGVLSNGNFYGGYEASWTFSATSLATTSHGYILGSVPSDFYASYGSSTVKVWTKNDGNVADLIGEFTDLPNIDEILNDIQNNWEPPSSITGHALPSAPTENPNNNDFQNRLQMFEYLKDSINAIVGNLGFNIKNWFDNLVGKMVEGFNSVSQNIHNGFKTLMDNIKDFFGPKIDAIIEKFNYITEPFDSQELSSNLNNASFSSDFLSLITTVSSFGSALTSGTEPTSCSFILDFSNSYYNFGVCEFSLDWILPFRSIIRLIIGCLCVYSLIISIFTSLNTYIGGTSSINDDI